MEEYIDSLPWLDTAVWRQISVVRNLHQALRAGQCSEALYPLSLLQTIRRLATSHGLHALPSEWYYENVPVSPIMINEGLMTFGVTFPFTNDKIYRHYKIQAFDVPMDNIGSRARVSVEADTAMDMTNVYWFVPDYCIGHRPQLCRAGPRWREAYP